ncbi:YfjI family protein [Bosea sp. NBC_00550]|uniref:YfjI family protein n=1 Tax=Bosea sp. NBC_00550 TaxID=2969621 RepID=UPI0022325C05|nr:YfjI family protein [Bosea sp. NBC_00550]UZF90415.1 YfjI family protein [Bosea sp. NBC_00550]
MAFDKIDLSDLDIKPAPFAPALLLSQTSDARRQDSDRADGEWPRPEPIVTALPPVAGFAADLLPNRLRGYVFDVAERQQSPRDFVAVALLCGIAAVVGNQVRVSPKQHDDWTVVPNLWGVEIGPPSAMKSPAMRAALAPIYKLEDEMRDLWEQRCAAIAEDEALAELSAKAAKSKAAKAMKAGDREDARRLLKESQDDGEEPPPCPRLIVNDATVEKLGELLNENPNGLLLIRDELPGFLARMEDEDCQGERAFYLEAYNGDGSFTFDRIGRGAPNTSRPARSPSSAASSPPASSRWSEARSRAPAMTACSSASR